MWTKVALLILLVAVSIPFYYGSTNPKYLRLKVFHSIFTLKHRLFPDEHRPKLSAEYRGFEDLLRRAPIARVDANRDPLEMVQVMRDAFFFDQIIPRPATCRVKNEIVEFDGKKTEIFWLDHRVQHAESLSEKILLYFHGGGYVLGDFRTYSGFECYLSRLFNVSVVHLEYRRAPEDLMPAAVDDALTLYQHLLGKGISSSRLVVMGDSAGGGLTLLTVQKLVERKLPTPCAAVALSPWADLSASTESHTRNRLTDVMLRAESVAWIIRRVIGETMEANDAAHSPMFGSFEGFPPLLINFGTAEILEDEGRQVAEKAQRQGVDVKVIVGEHLLHVYPIFFDFYPEGNEALDAIRQWLEEKCR